MCLDYLFRTQQPDGSWYGRWGTNYIYGTWSVLFALEREDLRPNILPLGARPMAQTVQRADGGWGESCDTYFYPSRRGQGSEAPRFIRHGRCSDYERGRSAIRVPFGAASISSCKPSGPTDSGTTGIQCAGVPAGVLFEIPRLRQILSAPRARPVP